VSELPLPAAMAMVGTVTAATASGVMMASALTDGRESRDKVPPKGSGV
jgi:hypothetical protein